MAGELKRLRRKTRVPQRKCEELLVLTFHLGMPFLLPPDTRSKLHLENFTWDWAKHKRLLNRRFREAWNEQFHVILHVRNRQGYIRHLKSIVPSDELMFYRLDDGSLSG